MLALAGLQIGLFTTSIPAAATEYAKPISNQLNTTGRAITIPLPVKSDGAAIGDVTARIEVDDSVSLSKAELGERLSGTLDEKTRQALAGAADNAGFVALDTLKAAGMNVSFDPGLQEVEFRFSADQHADGEISLARRQRNANKRQFNGPRRRFRIHEFEGRVRYVVADFRRDHDRRRAHQRQARDRKRGARGLARIREQEPL